MHTHLVLTVTHRPGDTCQSVPMGHRAFPRFHVAKFSVRTWRRMAEAAARQAAAMAHARALAALAREMLAGTGAGDAFGCVLLLLTELAAALCAEPGRQAPQGDAAGPGRLSRSQKRRAQRKRAMRARFGGRDGTQCARGGGEGGELQARDARSRGLGQWWRLHWQRVCSITKS